MKINYNSLIIDYDVLEKSEKVKKRLFFWGFIFLIFHHCFNAIYLFQTNNTQSLIDAISALTVVVGIVILKYKRSIVAPTVLVACYGFGSTTSSLWNAGGIFSNIICWYIISIIIITVGLDRRIGIVFYIVSFMTVIVIGLLQHFKWYDLTKNILINGDGYVLFDCISIFCIMGMVQLFVFSKENIDNIWKEEKEKKIELLEIEKANQLLQDKINSMNFTKQLLENTEVERKRIATDLHDSISHELLNLKTLDKQDTTTINAKIDTIINDIRGISRNLHPVMFDKIGLVPNIEQLVERIQTQNDFLVSTDINYRGSLISADELQIYRVIQEALTNIIKYAEAHAAKITILEKNDKITIEIKDNGKGFNVKETLNSGKAFGLHNIIERSRVIGGEAYIQSSAEGTKININIPKKA